jgi:hypothetical protein
MLLVCLGLTGLIDDSETLTAGTGLDITLVDSHIEFVADTLAIGFGCSTIYNSKSLLAFDLGLSAPLENTPAVRKRAAGSISTGPL